MYHVGSIGQAGLTLSRVHYIDSAHVSSGAVNFFFRSNLPCNDTSFDYDGLLADMKQQLGKEAPSLVFPDRFYLLDIDLENAVDKSAIEGKFWADPAHAGLGAYLNWPMGFAGILPPTDYSHAQIVNMAAYNGSVWGTDKLPTRMDEFRKMLYTPHVSGLPLVLLIHCKGGCDRTGEFVGRYGCFTRDTCVHVYPPFLPVCMSVCVCFIFASCPRLFTLVS
jgi:hypothetical protein